MFGVCSKWNYTSVLSGFGRLCAQDPTEQREEVSHKRYLVNVNEQSSQMKKWSQLVLTYAPPPNGQNLHEKERFELRLAADRDRQEREGEIAGEGWSERFEKLFLRGLGTAL